MVPATHDSASRPDRHRVVVVGGGMAAARLTQQLAAVRSGAAPLITAGHPYASAHPSAGPGTHPGTGPGPYPSAGPGRPPGTGPGIHAGTGPGTHAGTGPGTHARSPGAVPLDVVVVGEEPHAPYNRVLLADVLAGRYPADVAALPAPPAAARWLHGVRVVRLDRAARQVLCDDGQRLPYDSLVLATGSNPVLPPLRGLFEPDGRELPGGVHAFRTLGDCLALAGAVPEGTEGSGPRTVVVGGGLLGVSAARALARRGAQVVLAHQGEHLMERQLDAGASRLLRRHVEDLGVEVHTECRVRGLCLRTGPGPSGGRADRAGRPASRGNRRAGRGGRRVAAVELADGYRLDAELVVVACGVRPRVGLARAAGLRVAHGIVVDNELRTSDPHIYAIGDCAEHAGVVYGLAGPAQEQADVLARVLDDAARRPASPGAHRYTGTRALTRLTLPAWPGADSSPRAATTSAEAAPEYGPGSDGSAGRPAPAGQAPAPGEPAPAGPAAAPRRGSAAGGWSQSALDLAAFGEIEPAPGDDVVHLADATRGAYRKVVVRGDRLVGGILLGDLAAVGALARAWEGDEPLPPAPLLHLLTTDGGS